MHLAAPTPAHASRPWPTPDWVLERAVLGELPARDWPGLLQRAAREAALLERVRRLEEDSRRTLQLLPPHVLAREVRRRLRTAPHRPRGPRLVLLGLALVAALGGLLLRARPGAAPALPPTLSLFRLGADGLPELLAPEAPAHAGDVVQARVRLPTPGYAALVSLDGRGTVSVHLPVRGSQAALLPAGTDVAAPYAFALDDAPGFERFVLVTCPAPFPLAHVVDAARALATRGEASRTAPLPLPDALYQRSLTVQKVTP